MEKWLDQKSMVTPGLAGAFVMMCTNTLAMAFDIPGKMVMLLALILSFLFSVTFVSMQKMRQGQRLIFSFLNALVIFSTANGTSYLAATASGNTKTTPSTEVSAPQHVTPSHAEFGFGTLFGISNAYADPNRATTTVSPPSPAALPPRSMAGEDTAKTPMSETDRSTAADANKDTTSSSEPEKQKPFFRSW